ncbi:xylulokinase [Bifidobacterium platyrrhinorum]|uniref:Gluconate kinase n=1 Tax=Bifidobacterium platyrrhinorum TaxID=2661628 RepID=A0A6L9STR7_9BIFI|nr:FGGY family carbohydrate kinase [Bifidobacterium platyrrhinorum]NEG56016.1 gluconate kinase [Bifidobacterium platyrrhinorum]
MTSATTTYAATFDAGTTALKGALAARDGRIVASASEDLDLIIGGDRREQDPEAWWRAFRDVTRRMLDDASRNEPGFHAGLVAGVICSGQMQDVIALDADLAPVRPAILYSDGRAGEQAAALASALGRGDAAAGGSRFLSIVGNRLEGCLPLPKLMWMREREPDAYARIRHVLISSKDLLVARLTGACIGDVAACSTAGAMDIRSGAWHAGLVAAAGLDPAILPGLHRPQDVVGHVGAEASALTGLAAGTPVYAGFGDAGATTFASGVGHAGQYNINLGTSGWIATVSPGPFTDKPGAANLAFGVEPGFVNAVPFLNAGDVHRWATGVLAGGDYRAMHRLVVSSRPGANGVLCLPYLVGERFPVMNATVRGAYVGLDPDSTRADMARAALEGVAFSIRQGMEGFDAAPESISLIGGGAREEAWCRIMADVLGHPVTVFDHADILPSVALASLVFGDPDLPGAVCTGTSYRPDPSTRAAYDAAYARFLALYPALATLR